MDTLTANHFMNTPATAFTPLFSSTLGASLTDHFEHPHSPSLVEQLQTTLEIDQLLDIFSMEAAKTIRFCGLTFHFGHESFTMRGSKPGSHQLSFNIIVDKTVWGQLRYDLNEGLSKSNITQLEKLHRQLSYPLRNALTHHKIKRLALKDSLTGLNNRGHFDDCLYQAMIHAKRKRETFALVMLDLDYFKQANDTYGHQAGDEVIKTFAGILHRSIRGDDNAFRLGGDEFAIIASGQHQNDAISITARIEHNVNNDPLMTQYGISASIGFSFFAQNDSVSSLYMRTDSALYKAKAAGRNCTKTA